MLDEVIDLSTGFGVAFMPALLLAMPCIVLVVVPMLVLALPFALLGALLAGPYLLIRRLRQRRPPTAAPLMRPRQAAMSGGPRP
jgi:hypothetical protein